MQLTLLNELAAEKKYKNAMLHVFKMHSNKFFLAQRANQTQKLANAKSFLKSLCQGETKTYLMSL